QTLQRDEAARFADSAFHLIHWLKARTLGGDKPKHHHFIFRYLPEGLERSRTHVVVFEQEPLRQDVSEDGSRDPLVRASRKPAAVLVSTAHVKAECDARKIADDGVVHLDTAFQTPALRFVKAARRWVKK